MMISIIIFWSDDVAMSEEAHFPGGRAQIGQMRGEMIGEGLVCEKFNVTPRLSPQLTKASERERHKFNGFTLRN